MYCKTQRNEATLMMLSVTRKQNWTGYRARVSSTVRNVNTLVSDFHPSLFLFLSILPLRPAPCVGVRPRWERDRKTKAFPRRWCSTDITLLLPHSFKPAVDVVAE